MRQRRLFWFNVHFVSLLSRFLCSRPLPACYDAGAGGQIRRRKRAHMPRRLSFTRLRPLEQPLVFIASSFILGLLFAARFRFSMRAWLIASAVLWTAAAVCLLRKLGGQGKWMVTCLLLILSFACGGALWAINEAGIGEDRVRKLFERGELTIEEPV